MQNIEVYSFQISKDKCSSKAIELNNSRHWLREVRNALNSIEAERKEELIIYAEKESQHDILEFFNGLRTQDKGSLMRYDSLKQLRTLENQNLESYCVSDVLS